MSCKLMQVIVKQHYVRVSCLINEETSLYYNIDSYCFHTHTYTKQKLSLRLLKQPKKLPSLKSNYPKLPNQRKKRSQFTDLCGRLLKTLSLLLNRWKKLLCPQRLRRHRLLHQKVFSHSMILLCMLLHACTLAQEKSIPCW